MAIVVKTGDWGGAHPFESIEQAREWLASEISSFEWLREAASKSRDKAVANVWDTVSIGHERIRQAIAAYAEADSETAGSQISSAFLSSGAVDSASPVGRFVCEMAETQPRQASYALAYLANWEISVTTLDGLKGVLQAHDQATGRSDTATPDREALSDLFTQWSRHLADKSGELERSIDLLDERASSAWESIASQEARFDELVESSGGRLTAFETAYNAELALRAPVEYWEERASHHGRLARLFAYAVGASFVLAALGLGYATREILAAPAAATSADLLLPRPEIWQIGLLALSATVAIWIIRILVRILLSHLHLETDARERMVMVKVYLAIASGDESIDPETRRLVLEPLFRPSSTGLIKEDPTPQGLWEWVSRGGSKG